MGDQTKDLSAESGDLSGTSLAHYRVLERLGAGGMGVVYRAKDVKLGRNVALKFLPSHLQADSLSRQRFVQEAKAASALDHPNICTIYEIGETAFGQLFIAMACYEGETLSSKLARGPLSMESALDYALQTSRGLAKAHSRGIVHRDIKPGNIMVTDDQVVKILDFGLAKMEDVALTEAGRTLGTFAYMSPEQMRGEAIDHQTDLWSLGVMLHEMLTGVKPFPADSVPAIVKAVLEQPPNPVAEVNPNLPAELNRIVEKCLQKERFHRYSSAVDLGADLQQLASGSLNQTQETVLDETLFDLPTEKRPVGRSSIIVLPFDDLSADGDNDYFSDGLTEEIITTLAKVKALRVISRRSAMILKGSSKSAREIGRELQVDYLLSGSVWKAGSALRINAHLIEARTDTQLWAEKYKGTLEDIFKIQESVAVAIVDALKVQLTPEEHRGIGVRPIENPHAYECYLRARQEIWRSTKEALERAASHLQKGLRLVGENALLYAGLGFVRWQEVNLGVRPAEEMSQAKDYADKAFELDPESPQGHYLLGLIAIAHAKTTEAVGHLKKSLEFDPNNPDALSSLIVFYGYLGKTSAAFPLLDELISIDPLTPMHQATSAWLHFVDGRFTLARDLYREIYQAAPENPLYGFYYALALACVGSREEAYTVFDQLARASADSVPAHSGMLVKAALQGKSKQTVERAAMLEEFAKKAMFASWILADCYALIDEREAALDWLENAVELGFVNYPFLSVLDPLLATIRGEERFSRLMAEVKTKWEGTSI